jgi:hypothetical protein
MYRVINSSWLSARKQKQLNTAFAYKRSFGLEWSEGLLITHSGRLLLIPEVLVQLNLDYHIYLTADILVQIFRAKPAPDKRTSVQHSDWCLSELESCLTI